MLIVCIQNPVVNLFLAIRLIKETIFAYYKFSFVSNFSIVKSRFCNILSYCTPNVQ